MIRRLVYEGIASKKSSIFGRVIDPRDNREYKTIVIDGVTWLAENFAYLPSVNQPADYSTTEAKQYVYGYYGTDPNAAKIAYNYSAFGVLYNIPAAFDLAMHGWRLPTSVEVENMLSYLGGSSLAGEFLKEDGLSYWNDDLGNNSSNFSARGAGIFTSSFVLLKDRMHLITSDESSGNTNYQHIYQISSSINPVINVLLNKSSGCSVRYIKDDSLL